MPDRTLEVSVRQDVPSALDVTFACPPGAVLGIFGPSGSGKTTILRIVAGLHTPQAGTVRAGAERWLDTSAGIHVPPHRRAVGFVFQEYALFPHMTALGNVQAALGAHPRRDRRRRAEELLALVHLSAQRGRRPAELSGGERQRVALARALARDPSVLLLDEPFTATDPAVRRSLQDGVDAVRQALDIPVVLVTHQFDDIVRLATHLLVLREGRAAACGTLQEVTARPELGLLAEGAGAGAVVDGEVSSVDRERGLCAIASPAGTLLALDRGLPAGTRVRIRIPAREVILAAERPVNLSVHNVLQGIVSDVRSGPRETEAAVQISVGGSPVVAEVTRDAVGRLNLAAGRAVYVLVKAVSLDVLRIG